MKGMFRLGTLFIAPLLAIGCAHQSDLSRPASQDNFGVQMARLNLWREAMFRFERAIEINPGDAQAHNNLAVAYEANGDFEKARKEYLEALRLDRTNPYIQKNYSRFVEFLSRNRKRQQPGVNAAAQPKAPMAGAQGGGTVTTAQPVGVEVPPPSPVSPPGATPSDRPRPPTQPSPPPTAPPTLPGGTA